ncbi:MAG: ATP-dependent Clp protease proteolytic subunit [Bacteroidota bacterium]|nr:ATP-dependent Clp protease proteolytic subunit [Bacteroidota bacterium]MDP4215415.1 ATP-dependent Clp protease proteolytic subunit [Bacteroidota bacterium]MDP4247080.1 ATP-dependent Clp protease proteolytic subunit [Bacteroidota bacterium]MDP4254393.1 ATP-dependent Clp protease proteolytic subunit [Bacteroidota bacterium]MDP4256742.1 ATP-dependent Clp protease proteolytic subunit [Bacteroidota bacterium]
MNQSKYLYFPLHQDDEPDENPSKEDNKGPELGMLTKKMEQYFFSNRTVELWGAVDDRTAKEVVTKMKLLDADKPGEEIRFLINSPGGIVTSGMVIYDTMKLLKSPVSTICMGLAASMGSVLLSGGVKGRRFVFPHAEIMIHQPSLGGYMQGVSVDLEIQARQTKKVKEISARILAENCGKKMEQILKDFDRDYWMDSKEAIEYGIVDQLIEKL